MALQTRRYSRSSTAVDNEHQHATDLESRIIAMKKKPVPLAVLFEMAGIIVGSLSRCTGNVLAFKARTAIEKEP